MKKLFRYLKTILNRAIYVVVSLLPQKDIINVMYEIPVRNQSALYLKRSLNTQNLNTACVHEHVTKRNANIYLTQSMLVNGISIQKNDLKKYAFTKLINLENRILRRKQRGIGGNKRIGSERAPCRNGLFRFCT